MNNTFDWNRFCKVVGKDCRNMWPLFGTTMLILAALPFALWLLLLVTGRSNHVGPEWRIWIIAALAALAAIMTPSRLYRTMNLRNEGIYYAMLPASRLEKYLSMLLYSFVVCPLVVYVGGMALDVVLTALPVGPYREYLWQGYTGFPFPNMTMDGIVSNADGFPAGWFNLTMMTSYLADTAIFIFTATLFKKHKVLFTFLWLYLIEFVLSLVAIPVGIGLAGNADFMEWIYDTFNNWDGELAAQAIFGGAVLFNVLLTAVMLWLAWRRLKKMPY